MARLDVRLFGPPRVERDGIPIIVDTRKAYALLAYLAVTGQPHGRDVLAGLLWPDADQAHARATLRRTLSALNAALDGEWLTVGRESIGLRVADGVSVDVLAFRDRLAACARHDHPVSETCPACLPLLTEAAGLYREDFLAGFNLRDSPEFDDWQFFQAEALRRELAAVLERLATHLGARGDFEPAIAHARRWLALDPLHEPAHRQLMRLYAWAGARAAARRQYRECVRILDQELGVAPLDETTALYDAIMEHRLAAPAAAVEPEPPAEPAPTTPPPPYPLVGRDAERRRLLAAYDAIQEDGLLVVLAGEVGIGKSRLAGEVIAHAVARGATVLTAHCYPGERDLAYGPFSDALRAALAPPRDAAWLRQVPDPALGEASRLLPELAALRPGLPDPAPLDSPGALRRFYDGVARLLRGYRRGDAPALLVVDDVHWLDDASLGLLAYLTRRLRDWPACVLLTWRDEHVPPEHPLRRLLADAERAGQGFGLTLERLRARDVAELARASAQDGAAMPAPVIARLYADTEGVPFFVVEYLASLARDGADAVDWALPRGVRDLLHARLDGLSDTGRQILTTAAAIGRSFDFDTLREASGRSEEEAIDGLEALLAHGLVREVGPADDPVLRYDFSHEKLRELVYAETNLARRRLLHRRIAAGLESHLRRSAEPSALDGQIAQHLHLAGREAEAAGYFRRAGEHARSLYANAAALAHFRAALALGHPDTAGLHEAIGDLEVLTGDYAGALASYQAAASRPEPSAALEHKLGRLHHRRGAWDLAEEHYAAALDTLGPDAAPAERARLIADRSLTAYHRREAGRALDLARQALAGAEAAGDRRALAQVHNLFGVLARGEARLSDARQHLDQSLALAAALGDVGARAAALNNLALVCSHQGHPARAVELAEAALALCRSQGDRHREAALHNNLADFHHALGNADAAMDHLKHAVSLFAEIGDPAGPTQPEIWMLVEW